MTLRRILECALILCCLGLAGCGWFAEPSNKQANEGSSKPSPDGKPAESGTKSLNEWGKIGQELGKIKLTKTSAATASVGEALKSIRAARDRLGSSKQGVSPCDLCPKDRLEEAQSAWTDLDAIVESLKDDQSKKIGELNDNKIQPAQQHLKDAKSSLDGIGLAVVIPSTPAPSTTGSPGTPEESGGDWDWLVLPAEILAAVVVVTMLIVGWLTLRKRASGKFDAQFNELLNAHIGPVRKQQTDLSNQLSTFASGQSELSSRISEIQSEIRSVGRLVREASLDGGTRRPSVPADSYQPIDPTLLKDEPAFPISTVDYLGKMQRSVLVVKPDFQNGILVIDPDGKGELALIRDPKIDDDLQPLFVVPRAAQFQTKQDFHTYYEKYYDCARPSAGEVWIVEPALVSKVQGGWLLREKGTLEIR
jgi:hypothetical protein